MRTKLVVSNLCRNSSCCFFRLGLWRSSVPRATHRFAPVFKIWETKAIKLQLNPHHTREASFGDKDGEGRHERADPSQATTSEEWAHPLWAKERLGFLCHGNLYILSISWIKELYSTQGNSCCRSRCFKKTMHVPDASSKNKCLKSLTNGDQIKNYMPW